MKDIVHEVVRRLADQVSRRRDTSEHPSEATIDQLCNALLSDDRAAAALIIARAKSDGASHEALCLSYLAVAARRLGEWWEEDRVSFVKVTLAASRIYAILRNIRPEISLASGKATKAATFASVPGNDHKLGVTMAAELLREKGWDIRLVLGLDHDALVEDLSVTAPDLIGISAGGKHSLPALIKLIVALRIAGPSAHILVCGQIADDDLALIKASGADFVTTDFEKAVSDLDRMVAGASAFALPAIRPARTR